MSRARTPKLQPLAALTPTLLDELEQCALRVAYHGDKKFSDLRRPTMFTALGEASHKLAEKVAKGEFDALSPLEAKQTLEAEWNHLIETKRNQLAEAWILAPVPPPERWPGYQRTRVRLLRSLAHEVACRYQQPMMADRRRARTETETWLEPPDLPLRGRADRVEICPDGVHLIDLKSSWTYGNELHEAHRQQLLLYAALWQRTTGEWPRLASVQKADGTRLSFGVSPSEAEDVVQKALSALAGYNAAIQRGRSTSELATPSAQACSHCPYRAVCGPFFSALTPEWGWYTRSMLGMATEVEDDEEHPVLVLNVRASNLDVTEGARARLLGFPASSTPARGEQVAIVDAYPTPLPTDLKVGWNTQLVRW